jgi:long-chain acyl-CoA synthetase
VTETPPDTLPALLAQRAAAHPREVVLRRKQRGIWMQVTWAELAQRVREIGMALAAEGIAAGDTVAVLSGTRPEAATADLGALSVGCVSACLPSQDEADRLERFLRDTACRLLFVENEEQLDKALSVRERCQSLCRIVIFDMKGLRDLDDPMCEGLSAFLTRGVAHDRANPTAWELAVRAVTPELPASLLLSADAPPQTLSHGDVLTLVAGLATKLGQRAGDERIALLPMSGTMERVLGLYTALFTRTVSNYPESAATLIENMRELQPTVLGAPAQVWDRFRERVVGDIATATWLQKKLFNWAIGAATSPGLTTSIARRLVLASVRHDMGLSRLRIAYLGGAAVPAELARWYHALGIELTQIQGVIAHHAIAESSLTALTADLSCAA